ncbi:MAG: hypothetical protein ACOC7U_03770, partial [Spirochaetota bacterium]
VLDNNYRKQKERAVLNRRLEVRKSVLQTRQKWMDKAFSKAYQRLIDQPLSEYSDCVKSLISKVSSSQDEQVVFGTKGEDDFLKNLIDELNREKGAGFSLAPERGNFSWGFTLRKGKVETNMSINSLFRYKRDDLEQKAWELLNAE